MSTRDVHNVAISVRPAVAPKTHCLRISAKNVWNSANDATAAIESEVETLSRHPGHRQGIAYFEGDWRRGTAGLRVVDLCGRLAIERPTVYRILSCLVAEGL